MEYVILDVRRGEGSAENLAALVAEGYEIASFDGLVIFRKRGARLQSRPTETPTTPAPTVSPEAS